MQQKLVGRCRVPALLAASLWAQGAWAQVGAPLLGYLPDSGHILPVYGIAASASAAPALSFKSNFLQMAISPRHDFALVSEASTGAVLIANPAGTTEAVAGTSAFPSMIALSPSASAAALWVGSTQSLEIVSGLPSSPVVRTVNAGFLAPDPGDGPAAFAVSDDGAWAAGAWPSGVWAFGPNGEVRSIFSSDRALALAFFTGQENLAVAAPSGVYSIQDVGGAASVSTLYGSSGLLPMGLAASADNSRVILSDRRGSIVTVTTASGASSTVECGCVPEGVFPMGGSVFRITSRTGSVFRVFDALQGSTFQVPLSTAASAATPEPAKIGPSVETLSGGPR